MKVVVLGCGPAGLMAAHAVLVAHGGYAPTLQSKTQVAILSRKRKSDLYGAQYLHNPIPGVPVGAPVTVDYMTMGTPEQYRRKVYGMLWDGTVSPEDLAQQHFAWDIRATYDWLWDRYNSLIYDVDVDPYLIRRLDADLVVNSIPRSALCHGGHQFNATEIIAAGDAPALGIDIGKTMNLRISDNRVICNGEENPSWYRASRIFGHVTIEWPGALGRVPLQSAAKVMKPTNHNCDCWPEVLHVGRYGTWTKGVLSHEAFTATYDKVKGMVDAAAEASA